MSCSDDTFMEGAEVFRMLYEYLYTIARYHRLKKFEELGVTTA